MLQRPYSACTNFIVTKGASTDGSAMVSYAADSHALYGALYHTPGGSHKAGTMMPVYEWDTGRYLTDIPQLRETYSTVGNMNEHSLIIGETTYGGRPELADSTGLIDYGSLIYITLQRAKTAREAIATIAELANTYGVQEALLEQSTSEFTASETDSDVKYIQDKGTLIVGITEFAPMDYKSADDEWIGFDADMAKLVAEKLGVEVQFIVIDWDMKVNELDSKNIDVVWNGMTLTDGVKAAMECSNAYCENAQVVITK